jgi:hypothetical protein
MKTLIKITALAVITAFAALSCAPDVELTERDWSEYDSRRGAGLTNNRNNASVAPSIQSYGNVSQLPLPPAAGGTALTDVQRELTIRFPADADFLKASNDQLLSKMKEFMSFYTFTNPIPAAAPAEQYVFSTKGTDMDYEFVRRSNTSVTSSGTTTYYADITIRLTLSALPTSGNNTATATVSTTGAVLKVDAAKYTVGGNAIDADNDGVAGEAIYDDVYRDVSVQGNSANYVPPGGGKTLTLTLVGFTSNKNVNPSSSSTYVTLATLSGGGVSYNGADATDPRNLRRKAISESLISKFKVQKFNDSTGAWTDLAATIIYQNNPAAPLTEVPFGSIGINSFTPEDLGVYRVYVSGVKGLRTSGQEGFYGAEQKISISGASYPSSGGLRNDYYVVGNAGFAFNTRIFPGSVLTGSKVVNYDNAGKGAVVEIQFDQIIYTPAGGTPTNYYLKEDAAMFKKNVKILYRTSGGDLKTTVWNWSSVGYVMAAVTNVTEIEVDSASYNLVNSGDRIRLGTDSGYLERDVVSKRNEPQMWDDDDDSDTPDVPNGNFDYFITLNSAVTVGVGIAVELGTGTVQSELTAHGDVTFVNISDVKFEKLYDYATPPVQNRTKVILTIDSGLKLSGTPPQFTLLLAPGFEYGHNLITFGSFENIDIITDGVRGWGIYDTF